MTQDLAQLLPYSYDEKADVKDLLTQNLYDRAGFLRYTVTPGGVVTEFRYNAAGHKIWACTYKERGTVDVDPAKAFTLTTLSEAIVPNPQADAVTHYITDAAGQACYIIDAEGYLTGQKFDNLGLVRESIRYAEKLPEGPYPTTLEEAEVLAAAREGHVKNQVQLNFYSARINKEGKHLLRFVVTHAGKDSHYPDAAEVLQYQYDVFGNPVRTIEYAKHDDMSILRTLNYAQMKQWCQAHDDKPDEPHPKNTVTETHFNPLNQKITHRDAQGSLESFEPDTLNNNQAYKNKNGYRFKYGYDTAGRQETQTQPSRVVSQLGWDAEKQSFTLTHQTLEIATHYQRDGNGRATQTIEGKGRPDERSFGHEFLPGRQEPAATTLLDVPIYQPQLDPTPQTGAARETFEEKTSLTERKISDAFGRETVIVHRDGRRTYQVYDNDNNLAFTIAPNGAVNGYVHDAWKREIQKNRYVNPIIIDNPESFPTGLTLDQVQARLIPHAEDRTTKTTYDRLGRPLTKTLPEGIFTDPTATQESQQQFYQLATEVQWSYGAFSKPLTQTYLIHPYRKDQPVKYFYRDTAERPIAYIDVLGYLTEITYNDDGFPVEELEYANPCQEGTFDQHTFVRPKLAKKDRYKTREFDKNGQMIAEVTKSVTFHDQLLNDNLNIPPQLSQKTTHRVQRIFRDKMGLPTVEAMHLQDPENGNLLKLTSLKVTLHSPIGKPSVQIGPAKLRVATNESGYYFYCDIPVIAFAQDSHGRTVAQWEYARSLDYESFAKFEVLIKEILQSADPQSAENLERIHEAAYALATEKTLEELKTDDDRISFFQHDPADNQIALQNPLGLVQYSSFNATPQQAAKHWWLDERWNQLTDPKHKPELTSVPWVERKGYDAAGLQTERERWIHDERQRDDMREHHIERQKFNSFGERTARGDGSSVPERPETFLEQWRYNKLGQVIASNEDDGVWRRKYYQPQAVEPSLTVVSATVDLSAPAYDDPRRLMNLRPSERRENWVVYDRKGRPIEQRSPIYTLKQIAPNIAVRQGKQTDPNIIKDLGEYAILWNPPSNYGTRACLWVRVYGFEEWIPLTVKTVKTADGKTVMGADTSQLITDDYEYKIAFYHGENIDPYACGTDRLAIVTGKKEGSKHLVSYEDHSKSTTAIYVTGNTTDPEAGILTGIRLFPPHSDEAVFLGVTPDEDTPNQFIAEGRGLVRGEYFIGRADINREIGDPITPVPPPAEPVPENQTFMTEIRISSSLAVTVDVYKDPNYVPKQTEQPQDIEPIVILPPYPVDKPLPTLPPEKQITVYKHTVMVTLTIEGVSEDLFPLLETKLHLRSPSGRTTLYPQHEEQKKKIGYTFNKESKRVEATIPIDWAEFIKLMEEDENGQPIWDQEGQHPTGYPIDYPVEVERVELTGLTEATPAKPDKQSSFPLFQKAPNAQQVTIRGVKKTEKSSTSRYPQRTLFIPQTVLKGENSEDNPISVRITRKKDQKILGTIALTEIDNPNYQAANLSALSEETIVPGDLEVRMMGANPIDHPIELPDLPKENIVDTRPYGSIGQIPVPFDPKWDLIKEFYISDVYVDYVYNHVPQGYYNDIRIKNYGSLPADIVNEMTNGRSTVKVRGYWYGTSSEQEVELLIPFSSIEPGPAVHHALRDNDKLFIPKWIEISVLSNGVNYLIYQGVGDSHYYNKPELKDQIYAHHSSYGFTTTEPIKAIGLEIHQDEKLITATALHAPAEGYQHYHVNLPEGINIMKCNLVPLEHKSGDLKPFTIAYESNVEVDYSCDFVNRKTYLTSSFRDYDSLRDDIKDVLISAPQKTLYKIKGHWEKETEEREFTLQFLEFYNGDIVYRHIEDTGRFSYDVFIPTSIQIVAEVDSVHYLIYEGKGDNHYYNASWMPDQKLPHHGLYAFTTQDAKVETRAVEARRKDDDELITMLPIRAPFTEGEVMCLHHTVEIPEEMETEEYNFIPLVSSETSANPVISSYLSEVNVADSIHHYQNGDNGHWTHYRIYYVTITNFSSLPSHLQEKLKQTPVKVNGILEGNPWEQEFELYSANSEEIVFRYRSPTYQGKLVPWTKVDITNMLVKARDTLLDINYFIYDGPGYKHSSYIFRSATPPEQIVSVQPTYEGKPAGQPLPILAPIDETFPHYYVEIPREIEVSEGVLVPANQCEFQPVGPAFRQPYQVQSHPVPVLSYKFNQHQPWVAESFWQTESWVTSQMYWTRYNEDWMDWWDGNEYRWEGSNEILISFPHSKDLESNKTYFEISYTLTSQNNKTEVYTERFTLEGGNNPQSFKLYSPYTPDHNDPAKLTKIDHIRIERDIDGQRVTVYDGGSVGKQHMLYLGPLPDHVAKDVAKIEFEFKPIDRGINGLWFQAKAMTVRYGTTDLAVNLLDSNPIDIGHYFYRFRLKDKEGNIISLNTSPYSEVRSQEMGQDGYRYGEFEVKRQEGVSVPRSDLSRDIIAPKETARYDRWNLTHYWDKRAHAAGLLDEKHAHSFEHDRDNHRVKETGPEIPVVKPEKTTLPANPPTAPATHKTKPGFTSLPANILTTFTPKVEVTLTTPQLSTSDSEPLEMNSAQISLKVTGLAPLEEFEQLELTLLWWVPGLKEGYPVTFTWIPKEARSIDASRQAKITSEGYEEILQLKLQHNKDGVLVMPSGTPQWSLKARKKGIDHTLLHAEPLSYYQHQKTIPGKVQPESKHEFIAPTRRVALFTADTFHEVKHLRYHTQDGAAKQTPARRTAPRKGEYFYTATLPEDVIPTSTEVKALVSSDMTEEVPEELKDVVSPTRYHYYDHNGQYLGYQRGDGGYWAYVVDGEGIHQLEYSPTALKYLKEHNLFGNETARVDAFGHKTLMMVDKGGKTIQVVYPPVDGESAVERREHNRQGHELQFIDGTEHPHYTQPGLEGRPIAERDGDGIAREMKRQPQTGEIEEERFADGTSNVIDRNFFGRDLGGTDRSDARLTKVHDLAGGLTAQTSEGGDHGKDEYGNPVPGQSLSLSYLDNGFPWQIFDNTTGVLKEDTPEVGGEVYRRLVLTGKAEEGAVTQELITERNLMGWIIEQSDIDFTEVIWYDDRGNKRILLIESQHPETEEEFADEQQVFTYNADDQVETARAARDKDNPLQLIWKNEGDERNTSRAEYEKGRKASLTFYRRDQGRYLKERYAFDEQGRLGEVQQQKEDKPAEFERVGKWTYDHASRIVTEDREGKVRKYHWTPGGRMEQMVYIDEAEGTDMTTKQEMPGDYAADGTPIAAHLKGSQAGINITSEIVTKNVHYEKPIENVVTNTTTIEGFPPPTTNTGTTYLDANGGPRRHRDEGVDSERWKDFETGPQREIYRSSEGTSDIVRYMRVYLNAQGGVIAEFSRDPDRPELAENGSFRFEVGLLPATEVAPQQHAMMLTAPPGMTLEQLSGGSQEWLDALLQANPGISARENIGGKRIKLPYGETKTTLSANDKGTPPDWGKMIGSTVPTAPMPYLPYPEKVGGFKQYLPVIVGVVVSIAAFHGMMAVARMAQLGMALAPGQALTWGQIIGLTGMSSVSAAAGASAAQLTAMELYPGLLPDGFNWNIVGDSALLGAMMGMTHGVTYNAIGVPVYNSSLGETSLGNTLTTMQRQATTYMTNYGFNKLQGSSQSFDIRGLVGVMLSGGVTETLLQQTGFVNDPTSPPSTSREWLEHSINDVVGVLGGGFLDAAFEQAFSGEPMNPEKVFAYSLGRLAGRQSGYGLKAMYPGEAEVGMPYTHATPLGEDTVALQTRTASNKNQSPIGYTSVLGHQRSVQDAVESAPIPAPTPKQTQLQGRMEELYATQLMHEAGNPTARKTKSNAGGIHRDLDVVETVDSYDAQMRAMGEELPIYDYPRKPQRAGNTKLASPSRYERYEEEEEEEIYFEEVHDPITGKVVDYNAYQNGKLVVPRSERGQVEILAEESAKSPASRTLRFGPPAPKPDEPIDALTAMEAFIKDGEAQVKRTARGFKGQAAADALDYASTGLKWVGKATGLGGTVVTGLEALEHYHNGNYYKAGELGFRAAGSGVLGGFAASACLPLAAVPGVITTCGIAGAVVGDVLAEIGYRKVIWPTYTLVDSLYDEWSQLPGQQNVSIKYNYRNTDFYGPIKPSSFNQRPY